MWTFNSKDSTLNYKSEGVEVSIRIKTGTTFYTGPFVAQLLKDITIPDGVSVGMEV